MHEYKWEAILVSPEGVAAAVNAAAVNAALGLMQVVFLRGQEALAKSWEAAGGGLSGLEVLTQQPPHGETPGSH
jgi:hypothetical protein